MTKQLTTRKRIRTATRNYYRNRAYKSSVKTIMKICIVSAQQINNDNMDDVFLDIAKAFSKIDKCVKRGVMHKNKGARKKATLLKLLKKPYTKAKAYSNLS